MKSSCCVFTCLLFFSLVACENADSSTSTTPKGNAQSDSIITYPVNLAAITKDWMTWYKYTYYQIRLAQNFIGYNLDSSVINKPVFLEKLATGKFIAIKVAQVKNAPAYKLFQPGEIKEDISHTTTEMAKTAISLMKKEGKPLPALHFSDMSGKAYDTHNTKGKLLVVKCWFINCVACVKEFPALNRLVDKYKNRQDLQFVSLASDAKEDLFTFLSKKEFKYAVIPEAKGYMNNELAITAYPTHLLVDKNGIIKKVTNSIEDLIPSLEQELK